MENIVSHTDTIKYKAIRSTLSSGQHNGAYYYSKEIVKNIIPHVKTSRPWDTLGIRGCGSADHAIVFLHHNLNWGRVYNWLRNYEDLVLVCSSPKTYEWAKRQRNAEAIYLPLSIDVEYVEKFRHKKTKGACYAGNRWKFKEPDLEKYLPEDVDCFPPDLTRSQLLKKIAPYRECYAVGRTALEAKVLGCEIKVCDSRYPDPEFWQILDNKDAAKLLQKELDAVEKRLERKQWHTAFSR